MSSKVRSPSTPSRGRCKETADSLRLTLDASATRPRLHDEFGNTLKLNVKLLFEVNKEFLCEVKSQVYFVSECVIKIVRALVVKKKLRDATVLEFLLRIFWLRLTNYLQKVCISSTIRQDNTRVFITARTIRINGLIDGQETNLKSHYLQRVPSTSTYVQQQDSPV